MDAAKIEEKLAARAAERAKESPVARTLRRHGLTECEACRHWIAASRRAKDFHENRCVGTTYAAAKEGDK